MAETIIGRIMRFTYPNYSACGIEHEGYRDYAEHSGALVTVEEEISDAFEDCDGNACRGYQIRALEDGWTGIVWPSEIREISEKRPVKRD
jgi:hypothetical protein